MATTTEVGIDCAGQIDTVPQTVFITRRETSLKRHREAAACARQGIAREVAPES